MAQRAMSITGCEDDVLVGRMVQVVTDMADYCRKNGISDGNCGMRSLIDWIMSTEITGDPYSSALYTIVSKATSDEEDRDALKATVDVYKRQVPMEVAPVSLKEALDFVRRNHRHCAAPQGHKFSVGLTADGALDVYKRQV